MSSKQTGSDELERPKRTPRGGYNECDRPKCGIETPYDGPCDLPVVPGMEVCHRHLEHAFDGSGESG